MDLRQLKIKSAIGYLYLVAHHKGLTGVYTDKQEIKNASENDRETWSILQLGKKELEEYFSGERTKFSVPLDPKGTDFQKRVWKQLTKIPYGKTCSYKDIAIALDDQNACRAVGTANGKNPLWPIIPCHRVITADGKLGGYSGGLDLKIKLLDLEKTRKAL